ncbi:MAG: GTP 3',8-cyclase MoaA [Bradymonadia bacterium]
MRNRAPIENVDALPMLASDPRGLDSVRGDPLTDRSQRRIRYLRVSVTDRCNYACAYCMPTQGFPKSERADVMRFEEIEALVGLLVSLGVERVRITGGEPLVRRGIVDLVGRVARLEGVREVALTTNGHLLAQNAAALRDAGLGTLNVSVDSSRPETFARLTRGGDLAAVVRGLEAARAAGFDDLKLNAVVVRGENDDELESLCLWAWSNGWVPRFIELMPIGQLEFGRAEHVVPTAEMRRGLESAFALVPVEAGHDAPGPRGPAKYWRATRGPYVGARVGLISPMSDDGFCGACNRARLTAQGALRACLGHDDEVSLLQALRAGATREALVELVRQAVYGKRPGHEMRAFDSAPRKVMTALGG